MKREHYDVAIIGAGPAGLICAIHLAHHGRSILLLEKNERPGRKLLLSGSGHCNITHSGEIQSFASHYGDHGFFILPALQAFTNSDLSDFFLNHGLAFTTRKDGKVFPETGQASDICEILINCCMRCEIDLMCKNPVIRLTHSDELFVIESQRGIYTSQSLVIATGGSTYPFTGSTGDGYLFAQSLSHHITPIFPALAPVTIQNFPFSELAGISFLAIPVSLWRKGRRVWTTKGDVLVTHRGLSGPAILDISRYIREGDELRLSFVGEISREKVTRDLTQLAERCGTQLVRTSHMYYSIPSRMIIALLSYAKIPLDLTFAHMNSSQRSTLARILTEFSFLVERVGDLTVSMSTAGGVELGEVSRKSLESRLIPHLYFAGEVLDIDGDTGGYNLQAAFSTGVLVAQSIKKRWKSQMD